MQVSSKAMMTSLCGFFVDFFCWVELLGIHKVKGQVDVWTNSMINISFLPTIIKEWVINVIMPINFTVTRRISL